MEIFPTEKVLEITLDYLDKAIVYLQSEEFPKIHTIVENLKEYKYVSAFKCMFLKHQYNRKNNVRFQMVAELLFSSVWNSSLMKVSTFM